MYVYISKFEQSFNLLVNIFKIMIIPENGKNTRRLLF